jgi:hypothetical protein
MKRVGEEEEEEEEEDKWLSTGLGADYVAPSNK